MKPVYIVNKIIARLADGLGNALTSTTVGSDQALDVNIVQTVASGGSDPVGLKNAASTTINPATEETVETISYKLTNLTFDLDSNLNVKVSSSSSDPVYAAVDTVTSITNTGNYTTNDMSDMQVQSYWWGIYQDRI